jgi:hypothetical protein
MNISNGGMFLLLSFFVFSSCATASFARVDETIAEGRYADGVKELEKGKRKLYRSQDAVLYYLDKGLAAHYAGLYGDSSALLEEGERAIEAAYTKSVVMTAGSYLVNDTLVEYGGEDYEDIYINAFNALNYYHRGNMEDAMVEIRRMNNKIQFLASKYGITMTELQEKALEESGVVPSNPEVSWFSDSALARYMGVLFHRAGGRMDDARIDYEQLHVAFANAPSLYSFPVPSSVEGELDIPPEAARLNVLAFSGLSPVKKEEVLRIPVSTSNYVKIALPVLTPQNSRVKAVEIVFDSGERMPLEPLEDMDAVARDTFKNKSGVIYLKTIIRAAAKGLTSSVLDERAESTEGTAGLILGLFSLGNKIFSEISEQADLRISRYFPAMAWVGALNLEPGVYSFTVRYLDSGGRVISSFRKENMAVTARALNLAETACLR